MKRCPEKIELHDLLNGPKVGNDDLSLEECKEYYKDMLYIRLMEQYLEVEYSKGNIRGFCHLVVGQEGLYAILKRMRKNNRNNKFITSYRCHGLAYATGCTIKEIVAETLGCLDGNCQGKGGSMHLYNDAFYGGHGIVGAQVPLGAGLAFSLKYKRYMAESKNTRVIGSFKEEFYKKSRESFINFKSDAVCYTLYGDGASNQGQVYETFNMCKLYNIPIVFIVENNQYGMYTPIDSVSVDDNFFKRGYGIPGIRISDSNISILKNTLEFAEEFAKESGPIIVQIDTYRICGHSANDLTQFYKPEGQQTSEENLDCFKRLGCFIKSKMKEDEFMDFDNSIKKQFKEEIQSIDRNTVPGVADLYTDIFYQ